MLLVASALVFRDCHEALTTSDAGGARLISKRAAIEEGHVAPDRCNDPELGKMGPDCIDHRGLLTDEQMAGAVQHQAALLPEGLGWAPTREPDVGR